MFCPKCRAEYRPGFVRCNDCAGALVEHLPERDDYHKDHEDAQLVPVFVTKDPVEVAIVRSLLEASGVEVFSINGKFAVAPDQQELARHVLVEYRGKAGEDPAIGRATAFNLAGQDEWVLQPVETSEPLSMSATSRRT